jgi:hypothetical protein
MVDIAVPPVDFNLAEDEGTGSQLWAGVGFAGSRGGAFRLFFGTDDAGWEWSTSVCLDISIRATSYIPDDFIDPACVRIQESPPYAILSDFLHLPATIQKDT